MKDYYAILGVNRDAHEDQIKQSYRKLALKYHPDRGGNAEDFKKISEAYAVLSDPQKKKQYDLTGSADTDISINFMDLFNSFFQHTFPTPVRQVHDRKLVTYVTLEEVMMGTVIALRIKRKLLKNKPLPCRACQGKGHIRRKENIGLGFMSILTTICDACRGVGVVSKDSDFMIHDDILHIRIEPGIPNGQEIRLKGKGDEMPGLTVGDILLTVVYKDHTVYRIHNTHRLDIATDITITLGEFLCGFEKYITLLNGKVMRIYLKPGDLLNSTGFLASSLQKHIPHFGLRDKKDIGHLFLFFKVALPDKIDAQYIKPLFPDVRVENFALRHLNLNLCDYQ